MGEPGGVLAKKSLARYQNAGLESSAGEVVAIIRKHKLNSSVFKEVTRDIHVSDPVSKEGLVMDHFKKYWMAESAPTTKAKLIGKGRGGSRISESDRR